MGHGQPKLALIRRFSHWMTPRSLGSVSSRGQPQLLFHPEEIKFSQNHDLATPPTIGQVVCCDLARRLARTEIEMRAFRVVFLLMLFCSPASAYELNMVGQGLIRATLEQVQRFAALRSDGKENETALQVVNHGFMGRSACAFASVKLSGAEPVARLSINGRPATVLQVTVNAFSDGSFRDELSEAVQYILVLEKGWIA